MLNHTVDDSCTSDRKAFFLEAIHLWVQQRKIDERMVRDDIKKLDSIGKIHAYRQSLLDNLAFYYAENKNADVAPGVLTLVTFFSDNTDCCCSLSVERIAKFLSRSPRRISDAIRRLDGRYTDEASGEEKQRPGAIVVEPVAGGTSKIHPWIHRSFGCNRDALTWLLDVRAPSMRKGQGGRPRKNTPDAGVIPFRSAAVKPLTPVTKTPDAGDQIPLTPASPNTTKRDTTNNTAQHGRFRAGRPASPPDVADQLRKIDLIMRGGRR